MLTSEAPCDIDMDESTREITPSKSIGRGRGRGRGRISESFQGATTPEALPQAQPYSRESTEMERPIPIPKGRGRGMWKERIIAESGPIQGNRMSLLDQTRSVRQRSLVQITSSPSSSARTSNKSSISLSETTSILSVSTANSGSSNYNADSEPEYTESSAEGSLGEPLLPYSYFAEKYFEVPKLSKRIRNLKCSKVKVLNVPDDGEKIDVSFQDDVSVERFQCLLEKMARFYTCYAGFAMQISKEHLKIGEIVAASVCTPHEEIVIRRVKIMSISHTKALNDKFDIYGEDIDDLNIRGVKCAFVLHQKFYEHPSQAAQLSISNLDHLFPKDAFRPLLDASQLREVMSKVTFKALRSCINNHLYVTNLTTSEDSLHGEIDPTLNWRFESLILTELYNYYDPKIPTFGVLTKGVVTSLCGNGNIGICLVNSLHTPIYSYLNGKDRVNVNSETQRNLMKSITAQECKLCLAFSEHGIHRVKIKSFFDNRVLWSCKSIMKGQFIDTGKESLLYPEDLICPLANNPDLPLLLSAIPPQAMSFRMFGVRSVPPKHCEDFVGIEVNFRVCSRLVDQAIKDDLFQVEVFFIDDESQQSLCLNRLVNEAISLRA